MNTAAVPIQDSPLLNFGCYEDNNCALPKELNTEVTSLRQEDGNPSGGGQVIHKVQSKSNRVDILM